MKQCHIIHTFTVTKVERVVGKSGVPMFSTDDVKRVVVYIEHQETGKKSKIDSKDSPWVLFLTPVVGTSIHIMT